MTVPTLCIIFNRPKETQKLVDTLLNAEVGPLYFASDGPRDNDDRALVKACRSIVSEAPWTVEVNTLFRSTNMGCRLAVITAIDWVLSLHEFAVILEDDIIPNPTFFPYMRELSDRYINDANVMMISGLNELPGGWPSAGSYFCTTGGTWGWGTWARAWALLDRRFEILEEKSALENIEWYRRRIPDQVERVLQGYELTKRGGVDTWDFEWSVTRMAYRGFSINPKTNLVTNIGTGLDATHTRGASELTPPVEPLAFPLSHTQICEPDWDYLRAVAMKSRRSLVERAVRKLGSKIKTRSGQSARS